MTHFNSIILPLDQLNTGALLVDAGLVVLVLLCVLVYYPAKPPRPPSVAAHVERVPFMTGIRQLLTYVLFPLLDFLGN